MLGVELKIDSSACVVHAYKLTQISRSALPIAVRQTLNRAALDVKLGVSDNNVNPFIHRRQTFFKASSHVDFAKGFDVNTMRSACGFTPNPNHITTNDHSVQDLEQQEHGGAIGGKSFIPLSFARNSKSYKKMVQGKFRIGQGSVLRDKIFDAKNNAKGKSDKQQFILSAIHGGQGSAIIGTTKTGKQYLFYINSVHREDGKTLVNSTPIYSVEKHRHITPTTGAHHHFMRDESEKQAAKMEANFNIYAEKQIYNAAIKGIS